VSISERPASVEDRAIPGHWEGDLIGGTKNSYIATLVERHSRYVMLVKVANKDTRSVVSALIWQTQRLPRELYKSLTWDRGKEWPIIRASHWLPMSKSISATRCDLVPAGIAHLPLPTSVFRHTSRSIALERTPPEISGIFWINHLQPRIATVCNIHLFPDKPSSSRR